MTLNRVAPGVHAFEYEVNMGLGARFPCRSTLLDTGDGLLLVSPGPIDDALAGAIDEVGEVRAILGPNQFHHVHLIAAADRYPAAKLWGAPGLDAKLAEERLGRTPAKARDLGAEVDWIHVKGAPKLEEVVLFHRPSRSLVTTDLMMNVTSAPFVTRQLLRSMRAYGRPRMSRLWRFVSKDLASVAAGVEQIRAWDFERVVVNHGAIVEEDAGAAFDEATAWVRAMAAA